MAGVILSRNKKAVDQARTYNYADIFPRKKLNGVEFDLLIHLKSDSDRRDILIGVEFKETWKS